MPTNNGAPRNEAPQKERKQAERPVYQALYGRNLPFMVMTTRSPAGFASRSTSSVKSIALMMPSPNSSWIRSLAGSPLGRVPVDNTSSGRTVRESAPSYRRLG